MTLEQTFFLRVLADHLNGRPTLQPQEPGLDWQAVLSMARSHQVEGILFYQCKKMLPPEVSGRLAQLYASSLYYYSNRVRLLRDIEQKFSEEQIPYYTVKGFNVAQFYPVPALRTMGDCDILVYPEHKRRAGEALCSLGFASGNQGENEWTYSKNNLEFELHDHLLYDELVNSQLSRDFTEMAWEYALSNTASSCHTLDWNFHFVFLLIHLKKHFLYSGVGFRQFMDLAVVVQHQELNWEWISGVLEKLGMKEFAAVCCTCCSRWFDVEMPEAAPMGEEAFAASTEKIFDNGVFGGDDAANLENKNLNALREKGKFRTAWERVFPPYRAVQRIPYYSFVRGKPWLLPVVWVYRLFRSLVHGKGADGVKLLTSAVNADDALDKREVLLRQWGL